MIEPSKKVIHLLAYFKRRLFLKSRIMRLIQHAETIAPTHLALETTAHCNGKCTFCPSPHMRRKRGVMTPNLFRRIIEDARQIGTIQFITHGGMGEPLLDSHIADRISYEKKQLDTIVQLHTNGSLLTGDRAYALFKAGLDILSISVNAFSAESHRVITGLDFHTVLDHVRQATTIRNTIGAKTRIRATIVNCELISQKEIRLFRQYWSERVDEVAVHRKKNWANLKAPPSPLRKLPCKWIWYMLSVHWDGSVSKCHEDYEENTLLGNLNNNSILEIFNHPALTKIRSQFCESQLPTLPGCQGCSRLRFDQEWWMGATRKNNPNGLITFSYEDF
ncbi:MAG: radical SAM protein [Proteobacteria bacterium]|nr:radical SAM protein [Pseudomonadota bacterium]